MTEEQTIVKKSGIAKIKPQYVENDHVWEVNVDFVANNDKRGFEEVEKDDPDSRNSEPRKKKRLRGQNKQRPRQKKVPKGEKLCFSMGLQGICQYGDNCHYNHNITSYLSSKPKDIGSTCYVFEKYGNCSYSLTCRFALKHIADEKNVINEVLWNQFKDKKLTTNLLTREIQIALRKRQYDFSKSEKILDLIDRSRKQKNALSNSSSHKRNSAALLDKQPDFTLEISVENFQNSDEVKEPRHQAIVSSNDDNSVSKGHVGPIDKSLLELDADVIKTRPCERKTIDFKNKLYLAPLTTVGNLPFRRICKEFGADITCGEMAMALNILQGNQAEWALLKRHHTEDVFGVQLCGAHADLMTKCGQLLTESIDVDFIDINMGCPIDMVYQMGAGSGLMRRFAKLEDIVHGMSSVIEVPLTLKMRTGIHSNENLASKVINKIHSWGHKVDLITIHGRSKDQRYTKSADWNFITSCAEAAKPIPLFGGGDILSYEDYNLRLNSNVTGAMIARGALIKPWIFKEIKEQKHIDISSSERYDILKNFSNYGLEHWGSDTEGVEKTRRFLLEWLSFLYRYIPVGLLECLPQKINERPPPFHGRDDLETLMASPSCGDWVKISEMLLGPVPEEFVFLPKHKANAYQ